MNKEDFITSLKNTTELKKLIIDNPELPLLIFHCCDDFDWMTSDYMQVGKVTACKIDKVTELNDTYVSMDDYEEEIRYRMEYDYEYFNISDEEFDKIVKKKINETKFIKAIVVYVR
ncbi:MAG TPA: hypothetical protein OIL97_04385 [Oscillospiraceae bacterium]|jgi:hypothetical protein|nr:hypothetical protein [Oscillospiraceae bacterium]